MNYRSFFAHALRSRRLQACVLLTFSAFVGMAACGSDDTAGPSPVVDAGVTDASPEAGLICIGVTPPQEAFGKSPGPVAPEAGAGGAGGASADPLAIGAAAPDYWLYDFQPQSCGFTATYGLPVFKGVVTLVALWAGW